MVPNSTCVSAALGSAGGLSGFGKVTAVVVGGGVVEVVVEVVEVVDVVDVLVVEVPRVAGVLATTVVATDPVATPALSPHAATVNKAAQNTARSRRRIPPVCQGELALQQQPGGVLPGPYARRNADPVIAGPSQSKPPREP